ncbi:hypothetical protein OG323_06475 [Streptomyces cyaneofuscatus]|uniref:hypothetical protein n=1 Tax=Streptomyces cyaneofuscatus TaxID=66883 RepID=UPI0038709F3F|nr:hypothetical protein OG323_06475 [Streptomyces cyaneofuscatus]
MSFSSLISRSKPKHRAVDKVAELEAENEALVRQVLGAMEYIGQLELVNACLTDTARKVTEQRDAAWGERDGFQRELVASRALLAPFLAAEANANAITVPASVRDTTAFEDQATAPIDVSDFRTRFTVGPVVSLHHSPQAADPTHIPAQAA